MGAPDLLTVLRGMGLTLAVQGSELHVAPRAAITDEARRMIRAHKADLLQALDGLAAANRRKSRALAYLVEHPEAKRACFADPAAEPAHVVLTVALREPWSAVEVWIPRERFDALALMELSLRYPQTSLFVPEH